LVRHGGPVDLDVEFVTELKEVTVGELNTVIGYNGVRHPKPVDDIAKKWGRICCLERCDGLSFDPIGELVDGDEQVGEACNTPGVCNQLSYGFELNHAMLSGDQGVEVKFMKRKPNLNLHNTPHVHILTPFSKYMP